MSLKRENNIIRNQKKVLEIEKILSKWKNNIENSCFESEFDWLAEYVEKHPEMGFVVPPKLEVTDMVTKIYIK